MAEPLAPENPCLHWDHCDCEDCVRECDGLWRRWQGWRRDARKSVRAAMRTRKEAPAVAEPLTDAEKLRTLATWFDHFDDWREETGKIAPGITDYREVQEDLRRIAALLDSDRLDVERLGRALRTDAVRDVAVHYEPERAAEAIAAEYARLAETPR